MIFPEALVALGKGHFVSRWQWGGADQYMQEYLVQLPKVPYIWKIRALPEPSPINYAPLIEDINAADWYTEIQGKIHGKEPNFKFEKE